MHILINSSFFFTNKIDAFHDKWLGMMKLPSNSSCNYFFDSWSSSRAILYDAFEIGVIPKANSMLNSFSLTSANLYTIMGKIEIFHRGL